MTISMEISEPSVLANLPLSQAENGRTFITQVQGCANGVKRKRHELCMAVDGDSINTYEVRHGRILSSYPIPPDVALVCPPYSLYSKSTEGTKSRSVYYVADRWNERSLTLCHESVVRGQRQSFSKSVSLRDSTAQVVQLEVLCGDSTNEILVVKEDGHFEVYNEDLTARPMHGRLHGIPDGHLLIAAFWFSPQQALKSVLKARPDIITSSDFKSSFILGVYRSQSGQPSGGVSSIAFGIWQLPGSNPDKLAELHVQPLFQHKSQISSPLVAREREPVSLTARDTKLVVKTQAKIYVFDLTSTTFRNSLEIVPMIPGHLTSMYISDALALSSYSAGLQLYNTRFRTLQAKLDLNKTGVKRKRASARGGAIFLRTYFPTLNRIIATTHEHLVAIDLHPAGNEDFSSAAKETSLLINSIGKGTAPQERFKSLDRTSESLIGKMNKLSGVMEQWQGIVKQIDQCISDRDFEKFEKICLDQVTDALGQTQTDSQVVSNYKVDFIMSKLFEYDTADYETNTKTNKQLRTIFPAPKILEALAIKGLLTTERLTRVLRSGSRSDLDTIRHGAISQILVDSDTSLRLLFRYLRDAPHVARRELCAATQLLLRQALAESKKRSFVMLEDSQVKHIDILPTSSRAMAGSLAFDVTECLSTAIGRLAEISPDDLTRFMQESFTQEETIALVQFLRQQLFRSGYTRSLRAQLYPSPPTSEHGSSADGRSRQPGRTELTLAAIASTLSSCIDAIGPIGVLSFGDEDEFFQKLIPELSSEISRATQAVEESTSLEGTLRETIRFIESAPRAQTQEPGTSDLSDAQKPKLGSVITLYSERAGESGFDGDADTLPLSLRAEGKLSTIKVRKGNGVVYKRSEREMGMQQDRLRGPYALERLIL